MKWATGLLRERSVDGIELRSGPTWQNELPMGSHSKMDLRERMSFQSEVYLRERMSFQSEVYLRERMSFQSEVDFMHA